MTSRSRQPKRPGGDPARRRVDPQRVLLRRVGRDPGLHRQGDPGGEQAPGPPARPPRATATDGNGPIGSAIAVVRDNELYVATVGPAEAYLIRQARLSTLPDPHRERGLPDRRSRARRLARRDQRRRLARPRLAERDGPARARRAQGRDGHAPPPVGDGAPPPPVPRRGRRAAATALIAFEATEVAVDPAVADARAGPARRSRWRAPRTARRSRSPTTSAAASRPSRPRRGRRAGRGRRRACRARDPAPGPDAAPASRPTGGSRRASPRARRSAAPPSRSSRSSS